MKRESERAVIVIFLGKEFVIDTDGDGSKLSVSKLKDMLGDPPFTSASKGEWELRLMDGITCTDSTLKEAQGEINVEGVDVCWVQNWWQEEKESLFDLLEERIRDVMSQKKNKEGQTNCTIRMDKIHWVFNTSLGSRWARNKSSFHSWQRNKLWRIAR